MYRPLARRSSTSADPASLPSTSPTLKKHSLLHTTRAAFCSAAYGEHSVWLMRLLLSMRRRRGVSPARTLRVGRAWQRCMPASRYPKGGIWLRRFLAFVGPGYMVAVGYMDPGNWATDIAGGARFGYTLLSVILLSNLMAILLQALAARLGIVTGRDLAQACRDSYPRPVSFALWLACEAAIIACDLAEVIGTAIALQLLFSIPLIAGALITALDAFLLLL